MVEIDVLPRPPQHYYQYDQPNSPHHNPYQHPDSDTSSSYRRRSPQELMSPSRPHRVPSDDYGSPGWPSPVASRPNSQLYLGEYGYDSRPSTPPQLRSPRPGAPFMHTNSSSFDSRPNFDSRPQTPMVRIHGCQRWPKKLSLGTPGVTRVKLADRRNRTRAISAWRGSFPMARRRCWTRIGSNPAPLPGYTTATMPTSGRAGGGTSSNLPPS